MDGQTGLIGISDLEKALLASWSRETSSDPAGWTTENPAYGQCAVTACVVQDYVGGDIVWAEVLAWEKKVSHYFNLSYCREQDFTMRQFPEGTEIPEGVPKTKGFATTRDYVLSFPATLERYNLLKSRVKEYLGDL